MAKAKSRSPKATPAPAPRIARVAKGKKPQYFSDPAVDKLLWMTVTLMQELSVTRDRLDAVERLLDAKKLLRLKAIEQYKPKGPAAKERDSRRTAYIERVMRAVQADLESLPGGPPSLTTTRWPPFRAELRL